MYNPLIKRKASPTSGKGKNCCRSDCITTHGQLTRFVPVDIFRVHYFFEFSLRLLSTKIYLDTVTEKAYKWCYTSS